MGECDGMEALLMEFFEVVEKGCGMEMFGCVEVEDDGGGCFEEMG